MITPDKNAADLKDYDRAAVQDLAGHRAAGSAAFEPLPEPADQFFLEGVIVCVHYGDFLRETLAHNLNHFDELVVVTSPDDRETLDLCSQWSVHCVATEVHHDRRGDVFNKGRSINLGLAHLRRLGWCLHLDADIVLPANFRYMLSHRPLDSQCIYGMDRLHVTGWQAWQDLQASEQFRRPYRNHFRIDLPSLRLGFAPVHHSYGYCPIGYSQLWHSKWRDRRYPENQGTAEHTDVLFSLQWEWSKRLLLPEAVVYHLETTGGMGSNWNGRKTPRFGPHAIGVCT